MATVNDLKNIRWFSKMSHPEKVALIEVIRVKRESASIRVKKEAKLRKPKVKKVHSGEKAFLSMSEEEQKVLVKRILRERGKQNGV